jgi:NAD(P)-dependent dehydrogenase (short-subunit alcohol dehydrogenase family)
MTNPLPQTILLAGATRGLGLGLVQEFLGRGWHVIATARSPDKATALHDIQRSHADRLSIETLDVAEAASIKALAAKLGGRKIDVLFVVAGISSQRDTPIEENPPEAIAREFITNATGPVALAERLLPAMTEGGTVAFMTSLLGSIASNAGGGIDLYRASKAALNMLAVNFSIRHKSRPVLLLHPGWVRTEMGGSNAPVDVETSAKGLAQQIEAAKKPGIAYLNYQGQRLPW